MQTINIGKLNKRITIQRLQDVNDSLGQSTVGLTSIKTVWGTLYPIRGNEFYEIRKIQGEVTHKCYIRYIDGIDSNCFLKYKDEVYSIKNVIDVKLEHKMLEILCVEHINKEGLEDVGTDDFNED